MHVLNWFHQVQSSKNAVKFASVTYIFNHKNVRNRERIVCKSNIQVTSIYQTKWQIIIKLNYNTSLYLIYIILIAFTLKKYARLLSHSLLKQYARPYFSCFRNLETRNFNNLHCKFKVWKYGFKTRPSINLRGADFGFLFLITQRKRCIQQKTNVVVVGIYNKQLIQVYSLLCGQ